MEMLVLGVVLVNIGGLLFFWQKDQNVVYSLLSMSLFFLFGMSLYQDFDQEWRVYQAEYSQLVAEKVSDPAKKEAILGESYSIKQIWTPGLDVADRCTSCHLGYNNPEMKGAKIPYAYHEAARQHDFDEIGCVVCHQGQGRATEKEYAHAYHDKFWETPVLPLELTESSCGKCHDQSKIGEGEIVSRGKELFIKMGCHGCHKVSGYENLYKVATSLRGASHKLDPAWLVNWIKNPKNYLEKTRMPNFRFSEDEAVSAAAYILSQTDQNYKATVKQGKGDSQKGEKRFKEAGCLGCHAINGEGSDWASDLGKIGRKVNGEWLVNWILNPTNYHPQTLMPKFRLSVKEANNIAAYLMKQGVKATTFKYDEEIKNPERISAGKRIVQERGCTACHDINGIVDSRIGPELSKIGAKDAHHLDFGDNHEIKHTWFDWATNKIKDPTVYDTDKIKARMPTFNLAEKDRTAIAVFLKGLNGEIVPSNYIQSFSVEDFEIEEGRKILAKYNCRGCHDISGSGGDIVKFYKGKYYAPPPLNTKTLHVGDRLKDGWFYAFLRNPTTVRKWLKVKMPTFQLSQNEIFYLTRYFVNFGADKIPYDLKPHGEISDEYLIQGRMLVLAFACLECHDGSRGPDFKVVNARVRGDWAKRWLRDTKTIYPGTKMPEHWPIKNGKRVIANKFSDAKGMLGGDPDKQIDAIWAYLSNYDKKSFLNVELPEDEDEDEEEEEED